MTAIAEYLLWLFLPFGIGFYMVSVCGSVSPGNIRSLRLCLGLGVGLAATACATFLSLALFGGRTRAFTGMGLLILAVLLGFRFFLHRDRRTVSAESSEPTPYREFIILVVTIAGTIFALTAFVRGFAFPHGGWDAWMIWNVRARWLFRAATGWSNSAFSPLLANTDYPLFLPSTVLEGWNMLGQETTWIPVTVGIVFELACVALLLFALWNLASPMKAIMGVLVLMATPLLVELGSFQYADVPIAYFFLATLVFIGLHDCVFPERHGWLVLAGFSAGIGCWTKNEGILFACAIIAARVVTVAWRDVKSLARDLIHLGAGAIVPLLIVFYFKHVFAPPSVMFGAQTVSGFGQQIFDGSRHALIQSAFFHEILKFGHWKMSPIPLLAVYAAVSGLEIHGRQKHFLVMCVAVFLMMSVGYYGVYLTEAVSTAQLQQHLDTSLTRLLFQLWPIFLLIYFLSIRGPEQDIKAIL